MDEEREEQTQGGAGEHEEEDVETSSANAGDYWQLDRPSLSQRNKFLLDNGLLSDCAFIVGLEPNIKVFKCHKLMLAQASPVFEAMIYRPLNDSTGEEFTIKEIEPEIFQAMLEFVYSGEYTKLELEKAFKLSQVSDEYLMPCLQEKTYENVLLQLHMGTALLAWELATKHNTQVAKKLEQRAMKIILEHTDEVVAADSFLGADHSTVLHVVKQNALHISEPKLILACELWAENQAKLQIMEPETKNLRTILDDIFSYLRFLTLNETELDMIKNSLILSKHEKNILENRLESISVISVISGFSDIDTQRIFLNPEEKVATFDFSNMITNYSSTIFRDLYENGSILQLHLRPSHDVVLLGFHSSHDWDYPNWQVILRNEHDVICDVGHILGTDIPHIFKFQNPILIPQKNWHSLLCILKKGKKNKRRCSSELYTSELTVDLPGSNFIAKFMYHKI